MLLPGMWSGRGRESDLDLLLSWLSMSFLFLCVPRTRWGSYVCGGKYGMWLEMAEY